MSLDVAYRSTSEISPARDTSYLDGSRGPSGHPMDSDDGYRWTNGRSLVD